MCDLIFFLSNISSYNFWNYLESKGQEWAFLPCSWSQLNDFLVSIIKCIYFSHLAFIELWLPTLAPMLLILYHEKMLIFNLPFHVQNVYFIGCFSYVRWSLYSTNKPYLIMEYNHFNMLMSHCLVQHVCVFLCRAFARLYLSTTIMLTQLSSS